MRTLAHPQPEEFQIDSVLSALADPIRRRIVSQLHDGGEDQACSAFDLPVSKSTSTYHFRVLREAGVIHQHYQGNMILNGLRREAVEAQFPGLLGLILAADRETAESVSGSD